MKIKGRAAFRGQKLPAAWYKGVIRGKQEVYGRREIRGDMLFNRAGKYSQF